MNLDAENIQRHLQFYLTAEDQQELVRELNAIAGGGSADFLLSDYRNAFKNDMLQGDGWRGFQLFVFETGERRSVRGVVLSNSCDIDPANPRQIPTRVIFAPLVRLTRYQTLLAQSGIAPDRITAKIATIRAQKTTNVFYLPAGGNLTEEYIVRLDEAHSMPIAAHTESGHNEKLFTLSNTGFYMFVLKLSVHF